MFPPPANQAESLVSLPPSDLSLSELPVKATGVNERCCWTRAQAEPNTDHGHGADGSKPEEMLLKASAEE